MVDNKKRFISKKAQIGLGISTYKLIIMIILALLLGLFLFLAVTRWANVFKP